MWKKPIFSLDPDQLERLLSLGTGGPDPGEEQEPQPDAGEKAASGGPPPAKEEDSSANATASLVGREQPGDRIGRYKLLRILGEGGMGMVYLAEQEGQIRRKVALKVIKPGMDSKRVIARFETERQALALLDHPSIAQVYDAGTTESGRPYFVMEHVKGLPITEYCDRHKLSIDERLRLFQQVCLAVHHAHQKGIIHRDLKPSNVMVSAENDQPIPKIIDFGVAKAISQPLTERTLFTEDSQLLGTPEYMSPEQAEMTNQDIDTRSDIYSLGVLLYELLTGTLPFESQALRRGSLEQMRAVLREEEPRTPSTRVSSLDAETSTKLAKSCRSDAATLRRRLRGDLDWITLKAMEKDRTRRYQTAHALAEDIERHLNNEPVLAGRPGTLYRFQKLVRRNKGVFAAVAVVAAALVIGLAVSAVSLVREQQARRVAVAAEKVAVAAQEKEAAQRQKAEALAYASDMSLAQQALAMDHFGRAWRLLEAHRPAPGEPDLRGWEWRYIWQECRSDALTGLCRYDRLYSVAYSRDGKMLAVAGTAPQFVEIWDVSSRRRIKTLQPDRGHLVAFSPRDDLLATDANDQICLWRTDTWECVQKLAIGRSPVGDFKFSPDGRRLACLSYVKEKEAIVWEVGQGVGPWAEVQHIDGVVTSSTHLGSLDFSPDGKALVIGDVSRRLLVIDIASGSTIFDISDAHPQFITTVAWSPDGSVIASGNGYTRDPIRLWDAASGNPLGKLEGHTAWVSKLLFSADGARLYSASGDQTIRIWDVRKQQLLATLRGSQDEIIGLALSPDGGTLASTTKDGVVTIWSARPQPREKQPRRIGVGGRVAFAFAPNSRVLAVPLWGTVTLFDLATFQEIEQIAELGSNVAAVTYSPDGTLLVSGGLRGTLRVWSRADHRRLAELNDHNHEVYFLCFGADGRQLLSVDASGKAIWWDTVTWQPVRTFAEPVAPYFPWAVSVSPDGRLLAVGAKGAALRWLDAQTGERLPMPGAAQPQFAVTGIAFSGDGTQAASSATDGFVTLWDPSSLRWIDRFKAHMQAAHGVVFSPDGRRLATGGNDYDAVKLWDLSTYRELMTLPGQGSLFHMVRFSPDGRWLAAENWEGKLHLWRTPSWEEIEAAEKIPESGQSP